MNFVGEPALQAIGVIGSDREVVDPVSFHSDGCGRVGDRFHADIFAGNNTVLKARYKHPDFVLVSANRPLC